jgi:hypothetical protein
MAAAALGLQGALGNRLTGRFLAGALVQPKLTIDRPGDRYEQEADRVADQVMRMPEPPSRDAPAAVRGTEAETVQRVCSECQEDLQRQSLTEDKEDEEELLQAKRTDAQVPTVTSSREAAVESARQDSGKPLDPATRAFMEPRFGHNFGHVRVHTGPRAAAAAQAVSARAFTVGNDVVFAQGQYSAETAAGQRLLAHELTHVVQQGCCVSSAISGREVDPAEHGRERRANRFSDTKHLSATHIARLTGTPVAQRAIKFGFGTENLQHQVVDPLTGRARLSEGLAIEFEAGMERFLALRPQWAFDHIIAVEDMPARAVAIKGEFKKNFDPPVEVIQTEKSKESGELYVDVRKTIDSGKAIRVWENVRDQVKDRAEALFSDVNIRTRKADEPAEAIGTVGRYWREIAIDPELFKRIAVSETAHASFDGFWILLHEMRHIEGENDPTMGGNVIDPTLRDDVIRHERARNLSGVRQGKAKVSLLGQVVSKLNILRIGFGLPLRTNYSEQGIITFTAEGPIGAAEAKRREQGMPGTLREEFVGADIKGDASNLLTSTECDPLAEECPSGMGCFHTRFGFRCLPLQSGR